MCPFCGTPMDFDDPVFYEYSEHNDWSWHCPKCRLSLGNAHMIKEEWLDASRKKYRANLKKRIAELQEELNFRKHNLSMYGKFMTAKQKVKLLAEELENNPKDS